jgi:hypothetical protein
MSDVSKDKRQVGDLLCCDVRHRSHDEWGLDLRNMNWGAAQHIAL